MFFGLWEETGETHTTCATYTQSEQAKTHMERTDGESNGEKIRWPGLDIVFEINVGGKNLIFTEKGAMEAR